MRSAISACLLPILVPLVSAAAYVIPPYEGWKFMNGSQFMGSAGSVPAPKEWTVTGSNVNGRLNVQCSGSDTVQIVPLKNGSTWTGGTLTSRFTMTPQLGRRTIFETRVRFGTNTVDTKQGFQAGLLLMSEGCRQGMKFPDCGGLGVIKMVNGQLNSTVGAVCTSMSPPRIGFSISCRTSFEELGTDQVTKL